MFRRHAKVKPDTDNNVADKADNKSSTSFFSSIKSKASAGAGLDLTQNIEKGAKYAIDGIDTTCEKAINATDDTDDTDDNDGGGGSSSSIGLSDSVENLETVCGASADIDPNDPFGSINLSGVDPVQKEQMLSMMNSTKEQEFQKPGGPERCAAAAASMNEAILSDNMLNKGGTNAALVSMAGFLNTAAQFEGPAVAAISATLIEVGKHLPLIGIAVGMLGYMLKAFQDSKETDTMLKEIVVWMTGIAEWLSMISDAIDADSASENTLEMFAMLNEKIQELREATNNYTKQGRFAKMFTNASFTVSFNDAQVTVTKLKDVLRDLLDLEQQNRQEEMLKKNGSLLFEMDKKNDKFHNEMTQMMKLHMQKMDEIKESVKGKVHEFVGSVAEQVFNKFRAMCGQKIDAEVSGGTIPFKKFKTAYENDYNDGVKITRKQERGLKHALDADNDGSIDLAEWLSFYKRFEKENVGMDEYMLMLEKEAPLTNYEILHKHTT
jgi:hypothetical protein